MLNIFIQETAGLATQKNYTQIQRSEVDFRNANPNKHEIVGLHEYGHTQQYLDIFKTSTFIVKVGDQEIKGNVDEVLNQVSAMAREEFIKTNGVINEENQSTLERDIAVAVSRAFVQVTDQVETKFQEKYPMNSPGFSKSAEDDSNSRSETNACDFEESTNMDATKFPDYSGYEEPGDGK